MQPTPTLKGVRRRDMPEGGPGISAALLDQLIERRTTPPVDGEALPRPALLGRLAAALQHRLTIISAPAGSGKTTLLSQWAAALAGTPDGPKVAWLSLGPEADDPAILAMALSAALRRAGAIAPGADEPAAPEVALALIATALAAGPAVLILDGAQQLAAEGEELLARLVEEAPPQLHIVVATRREPALPLPRLRLRRALLELRGADLAWDAAEAAELLSGPFGMRLALGEAAALVRSTEGWVTGLCLAAISLRGHGGAAAAFGGADRYVVDYFDSEVLAGQPTAVRDFLLRSGGLEELSAQACQGLMRAGAQPPGDGTPAGAQAMLEQLERHNLFIEPLDAHRTRYRYHPLFAEALRALRARYLPDDLAAPLAFAPRPGAGAGERPRLALVAPQLSPMGRVEEPLSDREQQILILTAGGRANREIAEQLLISEGTVKTHLKRIFNKLGARNRTEAVAIARGKRLIPLI